MSDTVTIAQYLFTRLHQLGVRSTFGVPGDYNLTLLDHIAPAGLHWIGTCNELNAAYAADGYARLQGLGAVITTFGVGELSAINGIANAYAELVPVLHIVGTPARALQDASGLVHHTLATGDFRCFGKMAEEVTCVQVNLTDAETAAKKIDECIEMMLSESRPAYLEIPEDMVNARIAAAALREKKLRVSPAQARICTSLNESSSLQDICKRMYRPRKPMILVDGACRDLSTLRQIDTLIRLTGWPTWTTVFGKGLVNEQLPNVYGIFAGSFSPECWKTYFESADLILNFGPHHTDTNTYNFTTIPCAEVTLSFTSEDVLAADDRISGDSTPRSWSQLANMLDSAKLPCMVGPPKLEPAQLCHLNGSDVITQEYFYAFINPLLRSGDVLLAETGTAAHGVRTMLLPQNVRLFTAVTWLSIGYMLPATLGAGIAQQRDSQYVGAGSAAQEHTAEGKTSGQGRAILLIGDGALQMTVQELSTIIREQMNCVIFLINNAGYTIERAIHGRTAGYNDISPWRHEHLLRLFGADEEHAAKSYWKARTWSDLRAVLCNEWLQNGTGVRIVEVFMDKEDVQADGPLGTLMRRQVEHEQVTTSANTEERD